MGGQPIHVGCGCDEAKVGEIVAELKQRMKGRGDTAQINRSEETLELVRLLGKQWTLSCSIIASPCQSSWQWSDSHVAHVGVGVDGSENAPDSLFVLTLSAFLCVP